MLALQFINGVDESVIGFDDAVRAEQRLGLCR